MIQKKFDIIYVLKIDTIRARIIKKLFIKFVSINNYYQAYLKVNDEIVS